MWTAIQELMASIFYATYSRGRQGTGVEWNGTGMLSILMINTNNINISR